MGNELSKCVKKCKGSDPTTSTSAAAAAVAAAAKEIARKTADLSPDQALDKLEKFVQEFEEKVLQPAEDATDSVDSALTASSTFLESAESLLGEVPVLGGAFRSVNKVFQNVNAFKGIADDVLDAGHGAIDYIKLLIEVGRKALKLEAKQRKRLQEDLKKVMEELDELLMKLSDAVESFGEPGFLKRLWLSFGMRASKQPRRPRSSSNLIGRSGAKSII
eukprot:5603438-Prymnesium_polylepis.3